MQPRPHQPRHLSAWQHCKSILTPAGTCQHLPTPANPLAPPAPAAQVREIWLSSEDTGAYGRDIGTSLPQLLQRMVQVLPRDGRTMLRVGMTNPPFILEHLQEVADCLRHPAVFSYLHVPVQVRAAAVACHALLPAPGWLAGPPAPAPDTYHAALMLCMPGDVHVQWLAAGGQLGIAPCQVLWHWMAMRCGAALSLTMSTRPTGHLLLCVSTLCVTLTIHQTSCIQHTRLA